MHPLSLVCVHVCRQYNVYFKINSQFFKKSNFLKRRTILSKVLYLGFKFLQTVILLCIVISFIPYSLDHVYGYSGLFLK